MPKITADTLLRVTRESRADRDAPWTNARLFFIAPMRNVLELLDLHPDGMRRVHNELEANTPVSFVYVNAPGGTRTRFVIQVQP